MVVYCCTQFLVKVFQVIKLWLFVVYVVTCNNIFPSLVSHTIKHAHPFTSFPGFVHVAALEYVVFCNIGFTVLYVVEYLVVANIGVRDVVFVKSIFYSIFRRLHTNESFCSPAWSPSSYMKLCWETKSVQVHCFGPIPSGFFSFSFLHSSSTIVQVEWHHFNDVDWPIHGRLTTSWKKYLSYVPFRRLSDAISVSYWICPFFNVIKFNAFSNATNQIIGEVCRLLD